MSQHKAESHQFWSGFSFGLLAGTALLYFFATPKGRKNLTQYLEHAEVLEKDLSGVIDLLKDQSVLPEDEEKK